MTPPPALPTDEGLSPRGKRTSFFGFDVRSDVEFISLREGGGTQLDVMRSEVEPEATEDPLMSWTGGRGPDVTLTAMDDTYVVWVEGVGSFVTRPEIPSIAVSGPAEGIRREARIFGLPAALCFAQRGDLALHAAAIEVEGSALLLAAPGRHGKSTLAAAFLNAGFRPLSEDTTCYRTSPGPSVIPGTALLRIRPDVYERVEFPRARLVAEDEDRAYLVADESGRGDTSPVSLRAVIFLRQGDEEMRMERVPRGSTFPDLWTLSFHFPTDEDRARAFGAITALAGAVPVWNLKRRLSYETLPQLVDHIVETCLP
jgi:hypothetical protein